MRKFLILLLIGNFIACAPRNAPLDPFAHLSQEERIERSNAYLEQSANFRQGSAYEQLLLDSALMANPENDMAWYEKFAWPLKIGDYVTAFYYLDKAAEIKPLEHVGMRGSMKLYYLRDYEGAIEDYLWVLDHIEVPTTGVWGEDIHYTLGSAYWRAGQLDKAIETLTFYINSTVEELDESWVDVLAFVYRGICFFEQQKLDAAIQDFQTAIRNYEKGVNAYYYLAKAKHEKGESVEACAALEKASFWAKEGYVKFDKYRQVFGTIYLEDVERLQQVICESR